jgi:hypothetical protein
MFLGLIVGARGSPLPPLRGSAVDVSYIDGGRSWISGTTSKGGPSLMFLALMVDAPGSRAPPLRGSVVDVSYVDGAQGHH